MDVVRVAILKILSIVPTGLGLGKSFLLKPKSFINVSVPLSLFTSLKSQTEVGLTKSLPSK